MYKRVMGLEIHAQIATKTKLFSRSLNTDQAEPNEQVDWLDAGMPGALPVPNKEAINMALKTSLALNMEINEISIFDRKHYFYPDSPLGYQITQFYKPIGINGYLDCSFGRIRINRLHIESDAGKTIYDDDGNTYVDLNRAGVPLMEIVTEPDFHTPEEVVEFLKELKSILLAIGTSECNMEAGNLRADVNLSLHKEGEPYGNRVEMKNLNSFRFIAKAVEYETLQQTKILESGGRVTQETKLFDSKLGITKSMREKEDAVDYRYFPDPDLLPIKLEKEYINQVRENLPKLPAQIREEYEKYNIAKKQAYTLSEHPLRINFFANIMKAVNENMIEAASNWVCSELIGKLGRLNIDFEQFIEKRTDFAESLSQIIVLCENGTITRANGKEILDSIIENAEDINKIVERNGYLNKVDQGDIVSMIHQALIDNPSEVVKYKGGKTSLIMFFVGLIMKETKGKCDPEFVRAEFEKELNK